MNTRLPRRTFLSIDSSNINEFMSYNESQTGFIMSDYCRLYLKQNPQIKSLCYRCSSNLDSVSSLELVKFFDKSFPSLEKKYCLTNSNFLSFYNSLLKANSNLNKTKIELGHDFYFDKNESNRAYHLDEVNCDVEVLPNMYLWLNDSDVRELIKRNDKHLQIGLKYREIIKDFWSKMQKRYGDINSLNDFQKTTIVFNWIRENIHFSSERVGIVNGKEELIVNPLSKDNYGSDPISTYEMKRGVCEGQADLACILLNNRYAKVDCKTLGGTCPLGSHAWIITNINGIGYQHCLTMNHTYEDVRKYGYKEESIGGLYFDVDRSDYASSLIKESLTPLQVQEINESLKRRTPNASVKFVPLPRRIDNGN